MLNDAELRAALGTLLALKRALQANDMTAAWRAFKDLEMQLGRGLRAEPGQHTYLDA
jgi:hypothetical protein